MSFICHYSPTFLFFFFILEVEKLTEEQIEGKNQCHIFVYSCINSVNMLRCISGILWLQRRGNFYEDVRKHNS